VKLTLMRSSSLAFGVDGVLEVGRNIRSVPFVTRTTTWSVFSAVSRRPAAGSPAWVLGS